MKSWSTWIKTSSLILFTFSFFLSFAQNENWIVGNWKDKNHPEKKVQMYKNGLHYFGKKIEDQANASKISTVIFKELQWNEQTKSYRGSLINPDNTKEEFKIDIIFIDENQFQFKVGKFIFSKSFTFIRLR